MTHKNKIEIIKVHLQSERNKKKRKFQKKVGATNKKSPEDKEKEILDATVAWDIAENLPINDTAKKVLEEC